MDTTLIVAVVIAAAFLVYYLLRPLWAQLFSPTLQIEITNAGGANDWVATPGSNVRAKRGQRIRWVIKDSFNVDPKFRFNFQRRLCGPPLLIYLLLPFLRGQGETIDTTGPLERRVHWWALAGESPYCVELLDQHGVGRNIFVHGGSHTGVRVDPM